MDKLFAAVIWTVFTLIAIAALGPIAGGLAGVFFAIIAVAILS